MTLLRHINSSGIYCVFAHMYDSYIINWTARGQDTKVFLGQSSIELFFAH